MAQACAQPLHHEGIKKPPERPVALRLQEDYFFLCLIILSLFFLLCVAILCFFLLRPQGTAVSPILPTPGRFVITAFIIMIFGFLGQELC